MGVIDRGPDVGACGKFRHRLRGGRRRRCDGLRVFLCRHGIAGHQRTRQGSGEAEHRQRRSAPPLGGGVPQAGKTGLHIFLCEGKTGGQCRGTAAVHRVEQRVAVGRPVLRSQCGKDCLVAGGLYVPPGPFCQQPGSGIVPVQRQDKAEQCLAGQVIPVQVGQFMGQQIGAVRAGLCALRHQQYRAEKACRHCAGHVGTGQQPGPLCQRLAGEGFAQRGLPALICGQGAAERHPPPDEIAEPLPSGYGRYTGQPEQGKPVQRR